MKEVKLRDSLCHLDIHFINEQGIKEQPNPAIILKYINNEPLEPIHQREIDRLSDEHKAMLTKEILQKAAEDFLAKVETDKKAIEDEKLRKKNKLAEKLKKLKLDEEDLRIIMDGL